MRVSEVLKPERVSLSGTGVPQGRTEIMRGLAEMLSPAAGIPVPSIVEQLTARELLQSTAIGSGVAVPHARFDSIEEQLGALIIVPQGVEFGAIDGAPVHIVLGVIGPQGQIKRHLQLLTAISRVLRDGQVRQGLIQSAGGAEAFTLLDAAESR